MAYLKNSILKFEKRAMSVGSSNYLVNDYTSLDFTAIKKFIDSLGDEYFSWYQMEDNANIEKVSLDIYGSADYWDIILILNNRNPLVDMPHDFDTLVNYVESKITNYSEDIYGRSLDSFGYNNLFTEYITEAEAKSESDRFIKIIKPSKIQNFLHAGYQAGVFN